MLENTTSLQEFLDTSLLKTPKDYVHSLLKTVHSKNITIEDWNLFVYQLQDLIRQDADAYNGFVSVLNELTEVYSRMVALENVVGLSPDGQYIHVPIEYGEGVDSLVQKAGYKNLENRALSQSCISVGAGNISGMTGFWFTEINFTSCQIRLTKNVNLETKEYPVVSTTPLSVKDSKFECPYKDGDIFCIRIPQMHYPFAGMVTEVQGDVVFYEPYQDNFSFEIIPVDEEVFRTHEDYYSLAVPTKPDAGVIHVSTAAFSEGFRTIAAAMYGHTEGANTIAGGGYGHAQNFDTWAGYAAHSQGAHTRALAKYSTAGGFESTVTGKDLGIAFGYYNDTNAYVGTGFGAYVKVYGDYGFGEGFENTIDVKGLHGHVEGNNCIVNARSGHAQNGNTRVYADYGDASGFNTEVASGAVASRAAGEGCTTRAKYLSLEGYNNESTADALAGHGCGIGNTIRGKAAYVGGEDCQANYWAEFVHGRGLRSSYSKLGQTIFGNYNSTNDNAVFQIGNGVLDTARSNAFEIISTREGGSNKVSLVLGKTTITEDQLKRLLTLIA